MSDKPVTKYQLRPRALADLEHIWRDTARKRSVDQADKYVRGLDEAFDLLVEYPELERERKELNPPVRLKRVEMHFIIYQISNGVIDVIRIRHVSENWTTDPIGSER